jgi:replicative DNA helicase Mcm
MPTHADHDLVDTIQTFLADYYREDIGTLVQHYPREQRSLAVDYQDLFRFDPDLADDLRAKPEQVRPYLEEALARHETPVDISLDDAHVRVHNLPENDTYYPGEFSPSAHEGALRTVRGEVAKVTDVYARLQQAEFECQRCGSVTSIPQPSGGYQDPHECAGCERQGPFEIDFEASEFVDAQKLRIQTPPEHAQGDGQDIDVFVEDDLAGEVTAGDRVTVTGVVQLEQQSRGNTATAKFEPYLDGQHIGVEQTDAEDLSLTPDQREHIEELARGDHGDPLTLAAKSYAPKIHGHEAVKKALVLALVGGARTTYPTGDFDRGEFHVLLVGDPSTAKSNLVNRAEEVGWRAVGVSGTGATVAGVTATAVQDDFGDGSWTLDAGAAVKAHRGVLAVDELDDMPQEVRAALLEPMSKQTIHITKGGINTHLQTRAAVVAAANPEQGRFDPYEPLIEQFGFSSTLLSRFDLVFTFRDEPDESEDADIAQHILSARDSAKRHERGLDIADDAVDPEPAVDHETLRAWIALAKRQPKPVFASDDIEASISDSWTTLRGLNDYDVNEPVPVTFRTLEGVVRVAEAAAKFEFSETIDERHVEIATELVGQSMQDIGRDAEGRFDADVHETGRSKSQKDRKNALVEVLESAHQKHEYSVPQEEVIETMAEAGYEPRRVEDDIQSLLDLGEAVEPQAGRIRYIGRF